MRTGRIAQQDDALPRHRRIGRGSRREQGSGVGVERRGIERLGGGALHEPAQVHHRHAVCQVTHHREVVCDEQVGESAPRLEVGEQVQNLRLDGDVERRDGLVQHDELGFHRERPGDPHALALPARQLMGVGGHVTGVESHLAKQRCHTPIRFGATRQSVHYERLPDRVAHGHPRVERTRGILEYDLHPPAQRSQCFPVQPEHVLAVEPHRSRGGLQQSQDHPSQSGLAASALAHQSQRFAAPYGEAHAVHRSHREPLAEQPAVGAKLPYEMLDLHQQGTHARLR